MQPVNDKTTWPTWAAQEPLKVPLQVKRYRVPNTSPQITLLLRLPLHHLPAHRLFCDPLAGEVGPRRGTPPALRRGIFHKTLCHQLLGKKEGFQCREHSLQRAFLEGSPTTRPLQDLRSVCSLPGLRGAPLAARPHHLPVPRAPHEAKALPLAFAFSFPRRQQAVLDIWSDCGVFGVVFFTQPPNKH